MVKKPLFTWAYPTTHHLCKPYKVLPQFHSVFPVFLLDVDTAQRLTGILLFVCDRESSLRLVVYNRN